jgi:hypothetical protein
MFVGVSGDSVCVGREGGPVVVWLAEFVGKAVEDCVELGFVDTGPEESEVEIEKGTNACEDQPWTLVEVALPAPFVLDVSLCPSSSSCWPPLPRSIPAALQAERIFCVAADLSSLEHPRSRQDEAEERTLLFLQWHSKSVSLLQPSVVRDLKMHVRAQVGRARASSDVCRYGSLVVTCGIEDIGCIFRSRRSIKII